MSEKCFCHLNGYKVKDSDARKSIENLEVKITTEETARINADNNLRADINNEVTERTSAVSELQNAILNLEGVTNKSLHGKNIVVYGDSLTIGVLGLNGQYSERPWTTTFANITGANVTNKAIDGSTWISKDVNSFANRVDSENWNEWDIAILFYGTNDCSSGYTQNEMIQAMETDITKMLQENPSLTIWIAIPYYMNVWNTVYDNGITLPQMHESMRYVADKYNLGILDFAKSSCFNSVNMADSTFSWDGVHLTQKGYDKLGEVAAIMGKNISSHLTHSSRTFFLSNDTTSGAIDEDIMIEGDVINRTVKGFMMFPSILNGKSAGVIYGSAFNSGDFTCGGWTILPESVKVETTKSTETGEIENIEQFITSYKIETNANEIRVMDENQNFAFFSNFKAVGGNLKFHLQTSANMGIIAYPLTLFF